MDTPVAPLVAVTGFTLGFSNTMGFPYALAQLACGHVVQAALVPRRGTCTTCGVEQALTPSEGATYRICCGRSVFAHHGPLPNPHVEADRLTKVGDLVACECCLHADVAERWLRALDRSTISHVRAKHGGYLFYRRAADSPSGVFLAGSVPATPRFDALLRELGYAGPLSPTEGLYASGARW